METRSVLAGITIGLLIGAAVSLLISAPMLTQINDIQNQVSNLESQIMEKNAQIGNLSARVTSLESQIAQKDAKITNLTNTINELQAQMPPERKGEYNLVATFKGQSGGSTDYFYLDEPDVMLVWNWTARPRQSGVFSIFLWKQNASASSGSWTFLPSNGSTYTHNVQTGFYYLYINAVSLNSWAVSVYKWVPE